jgi:hypothetical protein
MNLCLAIPRCFLLTSRESAYGSMYCSSVSIFSKTSLIAKGVCDSGSVWMRDIFSMLDSILSPCLDVSVLSSISFTSFISLSLLSLYLGIGVLKFSFSILSICI